MGHAKKAVKRIGVLTAGSDSPGLNAAIRAIGKAAASYGIEVISFQDGFQGLIADQVIQPGFSGILTAGGTVLGTSRDVLRSSTENGDPDPRTEAALAACQHRELDLLVCIGGHETQESAAVLTQKGMHVVTLPKGIDNDLTGTDMTIGFDTALSTATEAIDRLHSTAYSHHRIIIVEIMGRNSGWLTLGSGIAGGADVVIIPEIPYDVSKIAAAILDRSRSGRRFSIIAVSEGGISKDTVEFFERSKKVNRSNREGQERKKIDEKLKQIESTLTGNTIYLANRLSTFTQLDTRITILGHLLRGGTPSATDRVLATNLGTACIKMIAHEGKDLSGVMLAVRGDNIVTVPLDQVVGKHKQVPMNHPWIESARRVGTSLGD